MTTDNFCFYLKNRLIQTSQKGGQQYSGTSPFSIPFSILQVLAADWEGTGARKKMLPVERLYAYNLKVKDKIKH
jgi:hypothetical protein